MVEFEKQLKTAIKTGKVFFGCRQALKAAKSGRARLIILASNCPGHYRSGIIHNARLSNIPVYIHGGTGVELGSLCDKPFPVAALAIRELGDSDILKAVEAE